MIVFCFGKTLVVEKLVFFYQKCICFKEHIEILPLKNIPLAVLICFLNIFFKHLYYFNIHMSVNNLVSIDYILG